VTIAGHLVGITTDRFGSELTADVAIGDAEVQVASTIFFNEREGGTLLLNGAMLAYHAFDDPDTDDDQVGDDDGPTTLTLVDESPINADVGDRVYELDPTTGADGDPVQEVTALVTIDDRDGGDALPARVRASLTDQLVSDFQTYVGKAVELEHRRGELVLVDILGSKHTGAYRWKYDYATATGNIDVTIRLTYRPVPDTAVKVSWGGVGLNRDEWDFTDPRTIVVPAQGFHADDVFEAHYAYTDPTARPVVPASLTLIGYTTATVGGPVALPVGTEAGHLLVIAAANYAPSSAPATTDARILVQHHDVNATSIGGSPNGGGVLAAMGVADGSGSAVTVTSAGGDIAIILAVFEYTGDLDSLWTPLRDAVADGHNYAMSLPAGADMGIALLAGICGTTSAPFSNDTTGDWIQVTFLSGTGTKATAQICYTTGPHNGVFHGLSTPSIWSGMAIGIEEG
jgi:hypothetical protein